jgi:hypothetical protein
MPAGQPVGHIDEGRLVWCRYVSAWLLLGTGFINILFGVMYGPRLRVLRGQAFPYFMAPGAAPAYACQLDH